ncbi:MAG: Gmad2 immunoglobulin-like domain-containing protein, partial [Acidimicrobiales bacterium]
MFNTTVVQQPQPNDIVGRRIQVGGLATGFEATIVARVRDGNGQELVSIAAMAGSGTGEIGQYHLELELPVRPGTPNGFVEVFEENVAYPDGGPHGGGASEFNKVVVPVVFGTNLVESYVGYRHHVVVEGDSLSAIALAEYGDGDRWPALFEANRDQIGDPNLIFHGQRLRIPHYVGAATTTVDVYFLNLP